MKKKFLHADKIEIALLVLLMITAIIFLKCCSDERDTAYADKSQTAEMIRYQQSEGRFAVEENGYINIRQ